MYKHTLFIAALVMLGITTTTIPMIKKTLKNFKKITQFQHAAYTNNTGIYNAEYPFLATICADEETITSMTQKPNLCLTEILYTVQNDIPVIITKKDIKNPTIFEENGKKYIAFQMDTSDDCNDNCDCDGNCGDDCQCKDISNGDTDMTMKEIEDLIEEIMLEEKKAREFFEK